MPDEPLIPPHGGYRNLKSFQVAQLVYDLTVRFCDRYVEKRSRTHDQMVQAARSGVQNIAEDSEVSATSRKMEIKLTQVARASLEELRLDYEDFLRHRDLPLWDGADPRRQSLVDRRCASVDEVAAWVREMHQSGHGGPSGPKPTQILFTSSTPPRSSTPPTRSTYAEIAANAALTLINVAGALLDRQIASQAAAFEAGGGFTERLHRVRSRKRGRS
jgi:four helix bundle suffix protein